MMSSPLRGLASRNLTHRIPQLPSLRNQNLENNIVDDFVVSCILDGWMLPKS
jgi:hypothetical protein